LYDELRLFFTGLMLLLIGQQKMNLTCKNYPSHGPTVYSHCTATSVQWANYNALTDFIIWPFWNRSWQTSFSSFKKS